MSFVFYDTETTGTATAFDQILQFAAIRTNEELEEIERFEIRSRLQNRVVAWPGALRVTGVTVTQLTDQSLPSHYEMVCAIREKLLSWSPAVFIGYNSMQFDEHLLRSALWKSLHNPYLTNRHGNARADAMLLVQAMALLRPDVVSIPRAENGKPSFKLDRVAPANGFDHAHAHDALADVAATIHLCRLASEHAPELWSSLLRFSQKAAVADFVDGEEVYAMAEYYYGKPFVFHVTTIGRSGTNANEVYAFDLSVDPETVAALDEPALERRLGASPRLVRRIKTNAAPILLSIEDAPEPSNGAQLSMDELTRRARLVTAGGPLAGRIVAAIERTRTERDKSPYVEEQIYDGFTAPEDEALLETFHQQPWPDRAMTAKALADERLRHLALRLIFDEHADALSAAERADLQREQNERLFAVDGELPWCTWARAIADSEKLLETSTDEESSRLQEYIRFCKSRSTEHAAQ